MNKIFKQAEYLAEKIRKKFNLGEAPIKDIFTFLEDRGIFVVKMPIEGDGLSGAFYYDKKNDSGKILINSNRTQGHQNFTAAHEFCHFILDKERGVIIEHSDGEKPDYEKRADAFAANFLMPKEGIDIYIKEVLKAGKKLDDIAIVRIQNEFSVSFSALINRLHFLGYSFNKPYQEKKVETAFLNSILMQLGFNPERNDHNGEFKLPAKFYHLSFLAFFENKISLNRLAELLRLSYEETKDKVAEIKKFLDEKNKR